MYRALGATPGQKRLILVAFEAELTFAALVWKFRLSRPTVQHVITGVHRNQRNMERSMASRQRKTILEARLGANDCRSS